MEGFHQEGTLLPWTLIEDGIVMLVEALGTWSVTVGIVGEEEEWQTIGE